jgi:hypothetical protein
MNEQETKRRIDEVLDVETGEIIKSNVFFQKPEAEVFATRLRLRHAIEGSAMPKFKCVYCNQLLQLSGKATKRGEIAFFAHLYDSEDCEIKTNGGLTKDEIESLKYKNVGESDRHDNLKNKLANILKSTPNISNVEIEKRLTSEVPYLHWRKPDVSAEFNGLKIVFEIQLSTTFLSVIIQRDLFYRIHNTFIIWVFNFSENKEYVNFQNLMIKDIYYANKRNAFVFDHHAQVLSQETSELHLLCIWFEPLIINGEYQPFNGIKKEEYVKISDLKFDKNTFKPYFIDADSLFAKYEPKYYEIKLDLEQYLKVRFEKFQKKNKTLKESVLIKEQRINETIQLLKNGKITLQIYQKNEKFGFVSNDIILIEPNFSDAIEIVKSKYYIVKKYNKWGLINFCGDLVLDCKNKELIHVHEDNFIVNCNNDWHYINISTKDRILIHKSINKGVSINLNRISDTAFIINIEDTVGVLYSEIKFHKYKSISPFNDYGLATATHLMEGNNAKIISNYYSDKLTVYLDRNGIEIISNVVEIKENVYKGTKFKKWGIETFEKETIIPFEYDMLEDFINGRAFAKKNGYFGYIDENGQPVIPLIYDLITDFNNGGAIAKKQGYFGTINKEGQTIIKFHYELIDTFINGKAKAIKNGKYGFIDDQGEMLIPFEFDLIEKFNEGRAIARKSLLYGSIDEKGYTIIPFEYDLILKVSDGRLLAVKKGKRGIIDNCGNTIIPFIYESIQEFINGKAKAKINGQVAIINLDGTGIFVFKVLKEFKGKYGEVIVDDLYGVKDTKGNILIKPLYNKIDEFKNGVAKIYGNKQFIGSVYGTPKFK